MRSHGLHACSKCDIDAIGIGPQPLFNVHETRQGGRTKVGTVGVAEKEQGGTLLSCSQGNFFTPVVDERKG